MEKASVICSLSFCFFASCIVIQAPSGPQASSQPSPSPSLSPSPAVILSTPKASAAPEMVSASINPLQKRGQILIRIQVNQVQGLEKAPQDAEGFLQADGASFKIKRENGPELASGQVNENAIVVDPAVVGKGPYELEIRLPGGESLLAKLLDTLNAGETRVLGSENVQVINSTNTAGGSINNQNNTYVGGNNCPGEHTQCSSGQN